MSAAPAARKVALIIGAGPGLGAALVRRFRAASFLVAGASRTAASKAAAAPGGGEFGGDAGVRALPRGASPVPRRLSLMPYARTLPPSHTAGALV